MCLQADPLNANVYIGSISPEVTDDDLRVRHYILVQNCGSAYIVAAAHIHLPQLPIWES